MSNILRIASYEILIVKQSSNLVLDDFLVENFPF